MWHLHVATPLLSSNLRFNSMHLEPQPETGLTRQNIAFCGFTIVPPGNDGPLITCTIFHQWFNIFGLINHSRFQYSLQSLHSASSMKLPMVGFTITPIAQWHPPRTFFLASRIAQWPNKQRRCTKIKKWNMTCCFHRISNSLVAS